MDDAQKNKYDAVDPNRRGLWIHTYTGNQFYAFDPIPEDICIEDIAEGLSKTCRYSGQCDEFYSVAQHSVIISEIVEPQYALEALLHDAPEAYITDIPRPIKHMLNENGRLFSEMEDAIYAAIAERFGLAPEVPEVVHAIDHNIVADEAIALFKRAKPDWIKWYEPIGVDIVPVDWRMAREMFYQRFKELYNV